MSDTPKRATDTGVRDGFLTALFAALSYTGISLAEWLLNALPGINLGKWEPIKVFIVIFLTALLKGKDRQIHEDPTSSATGLVKLPETK
jgi:hypothetical protein